MNDPAVPRTERRFFSLKTGQAFYGAPVGILQLERVDRPGIRPFIPGSVGNASTWTVPVRYKTIPGLTYNRLLGPVDVETQSAVAKAAIELEREGAQMITSNCGFMVRYQEVVRAAVESPVLLSSLLLGPPLERMLPREKALGIITANASSLTSDLLEAAGLSAMSKRLVIAGLEDAPAFAAAFVRPSGDLDVRSVEHETVNAAVTLLKQRPDIGMLLFECSELPPYAAAVQRSTGIPVFDFTSMIEFFVGGLIRKPFNGLSQATLDVAEAADWRSATPVFRPSFSNRDEWCAGRAAEVTALSAPAPSEEPDELGTLHLLCSIPEPTLGLIQQK